VSGGPGLLGKLFARFLANAYTRLAAGVNQAGETVIVAFAGHEHMIEAAAPGAESFLHRVDAVENIHVFSLDCVQPVS